MKGVMLCAVVALSGVGCASARYVQRDPNGGVVAMPANNSGNREKAMELIQQHVGNSYEIVDEREVVTGTSVTNHKNTQREATVNNEIPFLPAEKRTTTTTTTTRDQTEYRITYRRLGGPSAPPPPSVANGVPVTNPVQPAGAQVLSQPKQ